MLSAVLFLILGLAVIFLIIVANGYFVAQEFSFMSVDRAQLHTNAARGDEASKRALAITNRTSFMLSGAQLGITVTGLLVGYVAEPLVGESLGTLLSATGLSVTAAVAIGTVSALAVSTVVQMIFGELFPKNYTIAAPMESALFLSRSTAWYLRIFGPLIKFFDFPPTLYFAFYASSRLPISIIPRPPKNSSPSWKAPTRPATLTTRLSWCSTACWTFPTTTSNTP